MEGEEESGEVVGLINNLNIETARTEEEATEGLEAVLCMEVDGDGEDDGAGEVNEGDDWNQRALGAQEFLTQHSESSWYNSC